jgi:hypothetical protein
MIGIALAMAAASIDPGPRPTWQEAVALGNAALVEQLKRSTERARGVAMDILRRRARRRHVRQEASRLDHMRHRERSNALGGYSGAVPFVIVIRGGAVAELEIGAPDGVDGATPTCREMIAKTSRPSLPARLPCRRRSNRHKKRRRRPKPTTPRDLA